MPSPARPLELLERAVKAVEEALQKGYKPPGTPTLRGEFGAIRVASAATGINRPTFQDIIADAERRRVGPDWNLYKPVEAAADSLPPNDAVRRSAARAGKLGFAPVLPGYEVSQISTNTKTGDAWVKQRPELGPEFEVPEGHIVKGVSALVGPDGRTLASWVKTKEGAVDPAEIAKSFEAAFRDFKPVAKPRPAPEISDGLGRLTLFPVPDLHHGLQSWGRENKDDWDLKISESVISKTFMKLASRSLSSEVAVLLGGGDQMHANTNENVTPRSRHPLQVDGRFDKVLEATGRLFVRMADALLDKHQQVVVRILKGNHDEEASVAIAYFLLAWYRNEPRLTVDADPSLFWWFLFGETFLGATHGHTVKREKMPSIMAHREAKSWGLSKFRYVHSFHLHHSQRISTELEGVIVETHQSPAAQDSYNFGSGYLSGRSLCAITYDKKFGEVGRVREPVE